MARESPIAVYGAIVANVAIAILKFVAAGITGSSAMLSEAIHSVVDTGDGLLVLLGLRLSKRPPTPEHPFGHGMELYFWTLVVAMIIFGVGGGVSFYEGLLHVLDPEPPTDLAWSYGTLGAAIVFEGVSWLVAARQFGRERGRRTIWQAIRGSKDPTTFIILFEDSAALAGLVVALLGTALGQWLHLPVLDGVASIVIGLLLATVAIALARESRSLLVGESADHRLVRGVQEIVQADPVVAEARSPETMHLGPDEVIVDLDVRFEPDASAEEIAKAASRIEHRVRHEHPVVRRLALRLSGLARPARRRTQS